MKRVLQAVWNGIVNGLLTLTAAIIVLMLCAVAFSSRQSPSTVPAPSVDAGAAALAAQTSPAFHEVQPPLARPETEERVAQPPGKSVEAAAPQPTTSYEYVHGYTRKDGTVVKGYHRTKADSTKDNNWSEKGNTNPFTGEAGTKTQ